jgi:U3 small nucleolar RNA-associated protein 6
MKKRTAFETTLVRRIAKKADFLRYITHEADLEYLRRKRSTELGLFLCRCVSSLFPRLDNPFE